MSAEAARAAAPPLRVVHEDPDFVVVDKPSGVLSVPGIGPEKADCVTARVRAAYPGCIAHPEVHRLDMDTSGLLVVALSRDAHTALSRQFRGRAVGKRYVALLDGALDVAAKGRRGTIDLPFRLDVDDRPRQILDPVHGKRGVTHWEVLGFESGRTRVALVPVTGRTHQLRVHAAHPSGLGLPIAGDPLYGRGRGPGEMKLHAAELAFAHPRTGEAVAVRSAPPF